MGTTPCIPWTGHIDKDGYGIHWGGRVAHRVLMEERIGRPLERSEELDHLCHDPRFCTAKAACPYRRCVNLDHLEIVTHAENVARAERAQRTHCVHGHEYTPANTYRRPGSGARDCRVCINARVRAYSRRKRDA